MKNETPSTIKNIDAGPDKGQQLSELPEWIDGETLFGWCSRYHLLAGHRLSSVTCERLFGHRRIGLAHDLPGRLGYFDANTRSRLGASEQIALQRTVLGYYLACRTPRERTEALARVHCDSGSSLKASLGWLASRVGAAHPLKVCAECLAACSMPTWLLVHQLPGVWVCLHHGTALKFTSDLVLCARRRHWVLPHELPHASWHRVRTLPNGLALETARASGELARNGADEPLSPRRIGATLREGLFGLGLVRGGRLLPDKCGEEFSSFLHGFERWPEACALCVSPAAAQACLRRMLSGTRDLHPLHYLTAALWLFGTWAEFLRVYQEVAAEAPVLPAPPADALVLRAYSDDVRDFVVDAFCVSGESARHAAAAAGVTTGTALIWLRQSGAPPARRPKVVTDAVWRVVTRELLDGRAKQTIAARHGVSVSTVTRILLSQPEVSRERAASEFQRDQKSARFRWLKTVAANPRAGVKEIRRRQPAVYAWLYRHDRGWLRENGPERDGIPAGRPREIDWLSRDRRFAQSIKQLLKTEGDRLGRPQVLTALPEIAAKMRGPKRLPLTAALLATLPRR
jgi:predicted metal-binding protein